MLAVLLLLPAAGQAPAMSLDPRAVKSATLSNGLVLVVSEEPASQVVALEIVVRAGSADEPRELAGAAHLLEHVCWTSGGGGDPRAPIEAVGGATNAGTLRDYTRYYATVAAEDFPTALQALADMVLRPRLDPAVVDRERRAIIQEAAARQDQPRIRLNDLAFQEVFGDGHAYGRPIEGFALSDLSAVAPAKTEGEGAEAPLAAIEPHHLAAFHSAWYVPNNMAVVVVGRVGFETVLGEVERVFGGPAPRALPARPHGETPRPTTGKQWVSPIAGGDAWVMAAFVGPAASERTEVAASDVLSTILSYGCLGRLSGELVERRKLAKNMGVDFLTQRDRALFGVWAVCAPGDIAAVKEAICGELRRLAAEPVPPAELALAKRLVNAGYSFANETAADRAATLGFYEAVDSYRAATQYPVRVAGITADDVARVAGWYAADPVWVVLRPEGDGQ